jgi:hypothetical protein
MQLLINVPDDSNKPASFYGDNYGETQIRGTFDVNADNLDDLEKFWV